MKKPISAAVQRVDSHAKTSGETRYLADYYFPDMLYARCLRSTRSRARIVAVRVPTLPGGYYYIDHRDIPAGGENSVAMITRDWRAFAADLTSFYGETIGMVVGPDRSEILRILDAIEVDYEDLEPAVNIDEALALKGGPIHGSDNLFTEIRLTKGDPQTAFARAARIVEGSFETAAQEHVYLEPQALAGVMEDGKLTILASTQCPFYIRHAVATALGWSDEDVRVRQTVTGGGFGGKEHYPDVLAVPLAVATLKIGKPIQLVLSREEDMEVTSKRHPSRITLRTALDAEGSILGMDLDTIIDAGAYESSSRVVLQRALFTGIGVYDIPNVRAHGRAVATNTVPADAFRGFGAPQGLFAIEMHMSQIARELGVDEDEFRRRYFVKRNSATITNGHVPEDVKLNELLDRVKQLSDYDRRKREYTRGGGRGIALSFVQHGSGFTGSGERDIIKARVRLRRTADGRIEACASNVEIGQGVDTTFRKIVADVLEIPYTQVELLNTNTDLTPDSGPTCASRSVGVVGYLLQQAARQLKERGGEPGPIEVEQAYRQPAGINWDAERLQGDAYPSYGWGANCIEVEVDPVTLEARVTGIWAAFDIGRAIDELVVKGQIDGGIIQGLGYAQIEKLESRNGRFQQVTMADYVIPTSLDYPAIESCLVDNPYPYGPSGAKGAGEVVFDGAAPAFALAVQHALDLPLNRIPVTPEYILEVKQHARNPVHA
ncbi:MAG: aldehyde oxidase [Spirochaetaceae bacterium]|nr:MAG: aldehyde oxidase [Spirochaetaceae bacterium]